MFQPYNMFTEFEESRFNNVYINELAVQNRIKFLLEKYTISGNHEIAWLLKAISCIDLTTLAGDDTRTNVTKLCRKAVNPLSKEIKDNDHIHLMDIKTAAVCVYPSRVQDAVHELEKLKSLIPVASVATGFPSGQYPLSSRLKEIEYCVSQGAKEIDIVIDRSLVLGGKWKILYQEIKGMKEVCGDALLKTILSVGECGSLENVYKASMTAMLAGSNFIKTSTGKEAVNATLPVGLVMCRAIRDFYIMSGKMVGLKPAGGLKTSQDALNWLLLVKQELGDEWLKQDYFRIGASGLLVDIEKRLYELCFLHKPPLYYFPAV